MHGLATAGSRCAYSARHSRHSRHGNWHPLGQFSFAHVRTGNTRTKFAQWVAVNGDSIDSTSVVSGGTGTRCGYHHGNSHHHLVEEAGHGRLAADEQGPKRLSDATDAYLAAKRIRCSPWTIELEEERLSLVKKHFGDVPL